MMRRVVVGVGGIGCARFELLDRRQEVEVGVALRKVEVQLRLQNRLEVGAVHGAENKKLIDSKLFYFAPKIRPVLPKH